MCQILQTSVLLVQGLLKFNFLTAATILFSWLVENFPFTNLYSSVIQKSILLAQVYLLGEIINMRHKVICTQLKLDTSIRDGAHCLGHRNACDLVTRQCTQRLALLHSALPRKITCISSLVADSALLWPVAVCCFTTVLLSLGVTEKIFYCFINYIFNACKPTYQLFVFMFFL